MFVANVDGYEGDRASSPAQHRLNGHRQRAGFRIEQTTGTGATPFHEVFNGITAAEQLAKIFTEYGGVELVALKGTTDKERPQAAENRAGWPEVQVNAGSDVRRYQTLVIEHIGEEQIVHVAAVAGDIDNLMAIMGQLAYALGVMNVDALIEAVPRKAQNTIGKTNHLVREVRGNLFHQCNSVLLCFLMGNLFAARFVFNGPGNRFGGQQLVEQVLTCRKTWTDGSQTLTGEVHTRHARQFLRDNLVGAVFVRHTAQRNGRGETHEAVTSQPGDREEFLNAVKHAQRWVLFTFLSTRAATKHHRYRHHLHIQTRIAAVQVEIVVEKLNGLFLWRVIGKHARPAVNEHIARQQSAVDFEGFKRVR